MANANELDRSAGQSAAELAPFLIKSLQGTIVGRYASSTEAVAALPAAKKATGYHCMIVS